MTSPASSLPVAAAHPRLARVGAAARWTLAVLACLWLALCTAVGPLYWDFENGTIANWNWTNTAFFVLSCAIYLGLIVIMVRFAAGQRVLPRAISGRLSRAGQQHSNQALEPSQSQSVVADSNVSKRHATVASRFATLGRWITRGTNRFWKLAPTANR